MITQCYEHFLAGIQGSPRILLMDETFGYYQLFVYAFCCITHIRSRHDGPRFAFRDADKLEASGHICDVYGS